MKFVKSISTIFCVLLCCRHLEFQSVATQAPTVQSTQAPTIQSTLALTINSTLASTVNPTLTPTVNSTQASTVNSTQASTVNSTRSNNVTTAIVGTSISTTFTSTPTIYTSIASVVTNTPTTGQYQSRIRMTCSFADQFIQDYNTPTSSVLLAYLQGILWKLSAALPKQIIQLNKLIVYSVVPGSVVIDMTADFRSGYIINDTMLMTTARSAILTAFSGRVTIITMVVTRSSTLTKQRLNNSWIAGLIIAAIVAVILVITACVLWNRYCPNKCCCRTKTARVPKPGTENSFELEYDSSYNDKYPIVY